ncbi:MAG: hypothetical protein H6R18_2305, partial [Proteobacteria bacterium]|nr:hypothetical protein [Pseudomonadota bacterium]
LGGSPHQFNAPRLSVATILAAGVITMLASPVLRQTFPDPDQAANAIVLLLPIISLLAGLLQIAVGALNIASVIKYLPFPVLTGIMDGIAIQIIFGQLPAMLGYPAGTSWTALFSTVPPSALVAGIGLVTLAVLFASARWIKAIPPQIAGLLLGACMFHLLLNLRPGSEGETLVQGNFVAFSPERVLASFNLLLDGDIARLLPLLATIAVTVAIVATVQSLLSLSLADSLANQRSNTSREMIAQGIANTLTSLAGGYASAGSAAQVRAHARFGGGSSLAHGLCAILVCFFLFLLTTTNGAILRSIPLCVMGAILVHVGIGMTDKWTLTTLRRLQKSEDGEERTNLSQDFFLAVLVTTLTVVLNPTYALLLGMAAAFLIFLNRSSASLVRRRITGLQRRSMSQWSKHCEQLLQEHGRDIVILELQQPVFFGSADRVLEIVEAEAQQARYIILDLKRVPYIDGTGALALRRAAEKLQLDGKHLRLAHMRGCIAKAMRDFGALAAFAETAILPITEDALAIVEFEMLRDIGTSELDGHEIALNQSALGFGLSADECTVLEDCFEHRSFSQDEHLIRDGDPSGGLFLLLSGVVEISKQLGESSIRLSIIHPGAFFGEMAMITNSPRSADVFAQSDGLCAYLSIERFHQLESSHPELARKIVRNLYLTLADRLRQTSSMARELAE